MKTKKEIKEKINKLNDEKRECYKAWGESTCKLRTEGILSKKNYISKEIQILEWVIED